MESDGAGQLAKVFHVGASPSEPNSSGNAAQGTRILPAVDALPAEEQQCFARQDGLRALELGLCACLGLVLVETELQKLAADYLARTSVLTAAVSPTRA